MAVHEPMGPIGPEGYSAGTVLPPLEMLPGRRVIDAYGEDLGTIADVYVDARMSYARYLAISGAGGTRWYLIPVDDVTADAPDAPLVAPYERARLEGAPAVPAFHERVDAGAEADIYRHYGRPGYWETIRARQEPPAPTPEVARGEGEDDAEPAAGQTEPAPTPEIAAAEVDHALARGEDPALVRVRRWGA